MSTAHVCLACRRRIAQSGGRVRQLGTRRTFVSIAQASKTRPATARSRDIESREDTPRQSLNIPKRRTNDPTKEPRHIGQADHLEALFESQFEESLTTPGRENAIGNGEEGKTSGSSDWGNRNTLKESKNSQTTFPSRPDTRKESRGLGSVISSDGAKLDSKLESLAKSIRYAGDGQKDRAHEEVSQTPVRNQKINDRLNQRLSATGAPSASAWGIREDHLGPPLSNNEHTPTEDHPDRPDAVKGRSNTSSTHLGDEETTETPEIQHPGNSDQSSQPGSRRPFKSNYSPRENDNRTQTLLGLAEKEKQWLPPVSSLNRRERPRRSLLPDRGDALEALFEESLYTPDAPDVKIRDAAPSVEPYAKAAKLNEYIADPDRSPKFCWDFFLEHFGPQTWALGSVNQASVPRNGLFRIKRNPASLLAKKILHAKIKEPYNRELPTTFDVVKTFQALDILYSTDWQNMVTVLLYQILEGLKSPTCDAADTATLLSDLIASWNVVLRMSKSNSDDDLDDTLDWSNVPIPLLRDIQAALAKQGAQGAFAFLTPLFPTEFTQSVPLLAVATFAILSNESITGSLALQDFSPLTYTLSTVIALVPRHAASEAFHGGFTDAWTQQAGLSEHLQQMKALIIESIEANWDDVKTRADQVSSVPPEAPGRGKTVLGSSIRNDASFTNKRLKDALRNKDVLAIDTLWSGVAQFPVSFETATDSQRDALRPESKRGTLSAVLCNNFIQAYMSLRRPNRAIEVWNHMIGVGLEPDHVSWNALLVGCRDSRDLQALRTVWSRLCQSSLQPDPACWTTRICAHIDCNAVDGAMAALDEMGRLWLVAARKKYGPNKRIEELESVGDVSGTAKPNIITINAAMACLIKRRNDVRHQAKLHQILHWAGKFGIRPDIITYNTLLRSLVRDGKSKEVIALMQKMRADNIEPDVATFTTILDEIFFNSDVRTPEQLNESVTAIFSEMEAAGVKPNAHTYSRIMHQLLKVNNSDTSIAYSVLARMESEGIKPSPFIYTILVEHHFGQDPPNLDAVSQIIEQIQINEASTVDHVFWDRVVEGYARIGDTASATKILGQVHHRGQGHRVGWLTLHTLLEALGQNKEWDVATTLVQNVKLDRGGPISRNVRGKEGQHNFWDLAASMGL